VIIVMEPYDHHEDIVGIAFFVFCVFKGAGSPGVKREERQVNKNRSFGPHSLYTPTAQNVSIGSQIQSTNFINTGHWER